MFRKSIKECHYLGQVMQKCVLCHMRTTKAQISLRIRAVWLAPLLFTAYIVWYVYLLYPKVKIIASFCSWAGCFFSYLVENPRRHVFAWCDSFSVVCVAMMQWFNLLGTYLGPYTILGYKSGTMYHSWVQIRGHVPFLGTNLGPCTILGYKSGAMYHSWVQI